MTKKVVIAVTFAVELLWVYNNFVETVLKLFKQCLEKLESPIWFPNWSYPRPEKNAQC